MYQKLIKSSFILMVFSFVIIGCNSESSKQHSFYENIVNELSKPELMGRLTGTPGNLTAQNLIQSHFESKGLKPLFQEGFLQEYSQLMYHPDHNEITLSAKLIDGNTESFVYNKDFLEQRGNDEFKTSSVLTYDLEDKNIHNRIIALEESDSLASVLDKKPLAVLVQKDVFIKRLPSDSLDIPILQISKATAKWLKQYEEQIESIELGMTQKEEEISASNVIGFIPGSQSQDHRHAIVLSAHFDHIGWSGTENDRTIYQGSVDNASGVSALLQLVSLLSDEKSKRLQSDIIFAAFNGEESELQGSKSFVKNIGDMYEHVYNINLDCLGVKDGGKMLLVGKESSPLVSHLNDYLASHGVQSTTEGSYGGSDHISFLESGFEAVTLAQEYTDGIHTTTDVPSRLDYQLLDQFVTSLFGFIQEQGDSEEIIHAAPSSITKELTPEEKIAANKLIEQYQVESQQMHLGEYKLIGTEKEYVVVAGQSEIFTEKDKAERSIIGLYLPDSISNFSFSSANINGSLPENKVTKDVEFNKVYKTELTTKEVSSIFLTYKQDNGEGVYVGINRYPVEYEDPNLANSIEEFRGNKYTISDTGGFILLNFEVPVNDIKYYLQVYSGKDKVIKGPEGEENIFVFNWTSEDKQKALEWASNVPWSELIEDMGLN